MKTCPQCHTPLDEDAPEGLCPRCLAAAAFHSDPTIVTGGPEGLPDIANAEEVARRLPQYEILELLGRGGMGVVYKARQRQLDRIVALKILPPSDALSPDFIERFRREARSLAKLSHPNIVAIHDFGEDGGLYYFAMEYVDGANLREMLRTKKLTPAEALAVVPKICDALQYAHDEGVVHRDIKPENILVDLKGRLKIADFGLAKLLRRDDADQHLTLSGMALGTPRYMAPEQVDKPETVDHRADIYSLGVVFYEMLTGELPMGRFAPPSQKVQVDVRLDEIVLHALERDVERRYQGVDAIKTDVEHVTGKPQFAPAPGVPPFHASPEQPPFGARSIQPRFSGHAILGAVWAVFGLLAILSAAYFIALSHVWNGTALPTDLIYERPPTWVTIFMGALLAIGAGAFIGTPVLGSVSISRIRRSEGMIIGLPLAFADLLFTPFVAIGALCVLLSRSILGPAELALVVLPLCFFTGRAAWRAISVRTGQKPKDPEVAVLAPVKVVRTPADLLVIVASMALLTAVGIGIWFWGQGALHPESGSAFGDDTKSLVPIKGGQMIITGPQQGIIIKVSAVILALYGIIISAAGLLMRRLRARLFVLISLVLVGLFLPAALAYNFISEHVPQWPIFTSLWLGIPVCAWAVRLLFRDATRAAFDVTPLDAVDAETANSPPGGLVWPLAVCLVGVVVCAFPCTMTTSGFWGMPWWSSEMTGVGAMSVVADSPAAKAGILQEDHIKELNGTRLTGGDTLFLMWKNLPVGAPVELKIERSGQPLTLTTKRGGDSIAGQFYWYWQVIAVHGFLIFGALLVAARRRPAFLSGCNFMVGAGALVLLACLLPEVDRMLIGPSLWKNEAFGEGDFLQWPWQRVVVVIAGGLLSILSLRAGRRDAVEPDVMLGIAGLLAFSLSIAWAICRLTGHITNLEWAAILLTMVTAIGAAILFPRPRRGVPGSLRSKVPEIVLVLLGAGVGALPWTHTLVSSSGWQFWHGGIFSMIYFLLGLVFLSSGGGRPPVWFGVITILAALGAFACAFAFTTWPPEWHLFSDGTGTAKVQILRAGVFVAYGLAVLTAAMGAMQIRTACGGPPSVLHE